MSGRKLLGIVLITLFAVSMVAQPTKNVLLQKGWAALVKDNDDEAFRYFFQAYEKAKDDKSDEDKAESLLYLGICTYGSNLEKGLHYALQSLNIYSRLEKKHPVKFEIGRSKCLQLIGTIYTRQGKFKEAIPLSREVVSILTNHDDKSGTLGLAYTTLGSLYDSGKISDSAAYFYKLALEDFEKSDNVAYLPTTYIRMGELELKKQNSSAALQHFKKALDVAVRSENDQAHVSSLNALGKWYRNANNLKEAQHYFLEANKIAVTLSDKTFEMKTLEQLIGLYEKQQHFAEVSKLQKRVMAIKEESYSLEKAKIGKSLEVQFETAEKNRKLALISQEKEIARLTNYLLAVCIVVLLVVFITGYYYLKNRNKRDKQLLKTKEALVEALEQQKELKEIQFKNDLDHKESQLSAITLQMLQKNELLNEIKTTIELQQPLSEQQLVKMVNRHFEQKNNWEDFNLYFESINKNFYTRLKQIYPEISANDLKICALIKLNLSIKEMASILNISPDSVKTARYRLRKKLQMNADDNLTNFILSV
ncbi:MULTISPECIES: tetratricopeptide repeat protein [Flavobacterium]|uniref:tetratricopeptide repeat protein n=1 Tax=Flavobacterium TaxID=237 RepID=UPI0015AE33B3|nr:MULTISPECIES: tetratricopeptide repeat protein [Flavobacterium]